MEIIRILVIDNNAEDQIVLKALLSEAFPNILLFSAQSGETGIELCHSEKPDVVLLNIEMPEMDGNQVCKILKTNELTKTISIIMLSSGRTHKESRIKALEYGADAILTKPLEESELTAQIKLMLRIKELEDRKLEEKERIEALVFTRTQQLQAELTELKQAEEALLESEEKYSILFKDSPDSYLIISDGIFIDCNRATEVMLRGDRSQIIGRSPDELSPEFQSDGRKSSEVAKERIADAFRNGKNTFDWIHRRFDGSDLFVEVSIVSMMLKGKPTLFTTWRDITERKKAEDLIRESEDRYRSFISQVSVGVYRYESDQPMDITLPEEEQIDFIYDHMYIAECNHSFLKIYGVSDQNDIIGKGHLDFHGKRDNPVNRGAIRNFIRNGYRIENEITEEINISGKPVYISNNSLGIIENNHLVRTWGTETDITESIKADQVQQVLYAISNAALSSHDLKELEEVISRELGKLLNSTNFYIAFYDESSGMLSTHFEKDEMDQIECWPAEKSITGYVIRNNKSLLVKDAEVNTLFETGEIEMIGTAARVWLGVPLTVDQKVIGAVVVQSYDNPDAYTEKDKQMLEFVSDQISISIERKKAEQELKEALVRARESDRLKSAFLANVSHEIRTPLNSILGFSDLMLDPDFSSDQLNDFARMINASGNNLLVIINDIMDISKIEAGLVQLNRSIFSVQQLIRDIRKEYSFKALSKGIELRLDPSNPEKEIFIESDESKLRQILINFVGNAIKFTEKGFVQIGIRMKKNAVQFQVKDSGIGIPEEYHNQIFERFRQVEAAETRKYGGTGLGLAISKSLTELLGGEIGLESEIGKGSTFYFTIPLGSR